MPESTEQMSPTLNRQTGSSVETPVLKPAPIVASELLPVPSSNIPIGDPRSLPTLLVPKIRVSRLRAHPLPPTRATALGYRVVAASAASFGAIARPGAFRTFRKVGVDAGGL